MEAMSLYRTKPWLAVVVLAALAGASAHAQDVRDMQLFAPVEIDQFGCGPRADQGVFFQFDGLYWWILPPELDPIGEPGLTRVVFLSPDDSTVQHNTLDNSNLTADATGGQRYEFGYIHGHHGLMASIFDLHNQTQRLAYSDIDIVFDDQPIGPNNQPRLFGFVADILEAETDSVTYFNLVLRNLPVTFEEVILRNEVNVWGTEVDYIYRTHSGGHGGIFEFLFGVRYLEFEELFSFEGYGDRFVLTRGDEDDDDDPGGVPLEPGTILAESFWWADAENHIVGPQIGLRWFRQSHRWTWSTEARFFAGLNIQNLEQEGMLGTQLNDDFPADDVTLLGASSLRDFPFEPLTFGPTGYKHSATENEWSPGVEFRVDLNYKLTRAVDIRVGWTALWLDGIARASNLIDYSLTETSIMGIDLDDNRQSVFMHGLNIGFNINR
jgi:hypothetical protein